MEFFNKTKVVRLKSHLEKYLYAENDEETVKQSRNGTSRKAQWTIELVEGNSHVIRLKSCFGKYLTASDEPYLLGATGKKVLQTDPIYYYDNSIEWEPRTDGFQVKLKVKSGGKYLRANGATLPWRNSITHDVPYRTSTQDWILWDVEAVVEYITEDYSLPGSISFTWSNSSSISECSDTGSPSIFFSLGSWFANETQSVMEVFQEAKVIRLRSHHDKYLLADNDQENVIQDRNGAVRNARWTVELVENEELVRLKSCYGKYLTASNMPMFFGMTGRKVLQTLPKRLDSSVEWEPLREGDQVRLKTRYGQFLRANGGLSPLRNTVTHDIPYRTSTQDWVTWEVDIFEIRVQSTKCLPPELPLSVAVRSRPPSPPPDDVPSKPSSPSKIELKTPRSSRPQSSDSFGDSPRKADGRMIKYHVADDNGDYDELAELSFTFKGSGVEELKVKLMEETGLKDIVVSSHNPLNGKLYPLRLHLPPNNTDMHVVVVPSSFKGNDQRESNCIVSRFKLTC